MPITAKEARKIAIDAIQQKKLTDIENKQLEREYLRALQLMVKRIAPNVSTNIFNHIKEKARAGELSFTTENLCEYVGNYCPLFEDGLELGWDMLPKKVRPLLGKYGFKVKTLSAKNARCTKFQISY